MPSNYLAFDLGAESGRAILGTLDNGRLALSELHRFLNEPVRLPEGLYWDIFRLFHNIREGLRIAGRERALKLDGIAVDTWGVDFGLVDQHGELVLTPHHYRDARLNGIMERTFAVVPEKEMFAETGLQFMQFNSLFQLYAARLAGSPAVDAASRLLFVPDLLSYWLSGVQKNELTIVSTSQMYNPAARAWSTKVFDKLGLPTRILGEIVQPGAKLGALLPELQDISALGPVPVFASASHDTASAVAAVPATGDRPWCYISSGTWSLMGVELPEPIMTAKAHELTLTNEVGAGGRIRLLKNIAGLWPVQECRRAWLLAGKEYSYAELAEMAAAAPAFAALIDPDAFLDPGHMPERIAEYCRRTGQTAPEQPGGMVRTILESLALRYRRVLESLETLTGKRIEVIHIVGGGSQNKLLNRFVAEATGRTVVAGPAEATAAGNILVQAIGAGRLDSLEAARAVVRASFALETVEAHSSKAWDLAYERYLKLTAS
jgi:rhamnulokinase